MKFENIGVSSQVVELLSERGLEHPTSVQSEVIPRVLSKESLLVVSGTGSGKTLAYVAPIVSSLQLVVREGSGVDVVVLVPTRELALQVGSQFDMLCSGVGIPTSIIYGGVSYQEQRESLALAPRVVVSTVGRMKDLIEQQILRLEDVGCFVLDEVDQMLDMGFGDDVRELASCRCVGSLSLFFSATMNSEVEGVVKELCEDVAVVDMSCGSMVAKDVEHYLYYVERRLMGALLLHILKIEGCGQTIIFTRSRGMADKVAQQLQEHGFVAEAFHSERSQGAREHILERFRSGETPLIVATDVMARGIDVVGVSHVINYGVPQTPELYIHRVGRTARAGRSGKAITMCEPTDLQLMGAVQKHMRLSAKVVTNHPCHTQEVTKILSGLGAAPKRGGDSRKRR